MDQLTNIPDDFDDVEKYAPVLYSTGKHNPFSVPENYFADAAELFAADAKISSFKTTTGFELPENYFETLPELVLMRAKFPDLITSTDFTAPADAYFDALPESILNRIKQEEAVPAKISREKVQVAKIIQLHYRKVAIAASLLIIIGLGGLFLKQHAAIEQTKNTSVAASSSDIEAYLETNIDDSTLIEYVSEKEIPKVNITADKKEILNYVLDNSEEYKNEISEL